MLFNNVSENHVKTAFYLFNRSDQKRAYNRNRYLLQGIYPVGNKTK